MKKLEYARLNAYTVLKDLLRNLWVILLAGVVGFVGSVTYFSYIHPKEYTSTMTVSVNLGGYTNESTAVSLARTVTIAETLDDVFKSDALRDVVKKDLETDSIGEINASQLGKTNLIMIVATGDSPQTAYDTLKSVSDNYKKVTGNVFSNVLINVVVNPQMPSSPSNSVSVMNAGIICCLVCALLTAVITAFISYMRDTVKNVSDVEAELDTKLFGTVYRSDLPVDPKDSKHQQKRIITNPLISYSFSESYRRMAIKAESLKRTKGTSVFTVTSVAENEGKTTASVNLSIALAQNGNRVLLIDCDFKNTSVHYFFNRADRPENSDFHNFITNGGDITDHLYHDAATGVYVADSVNPCEGSAEKLSHNRFTEVIAALKSQFDFIIIDTPPCGLTVDAEIVSEASDAVLIVVRQDMVPISDINDHIESFNKTYVAGCIFNNVSTLLKIPSDKNGENSKYYYHDHT